MIHDSKIAPKNIPDLEVITNQLLIIQDHKCAKCGIYLSYIPYPHHGLIHKDIPNRRNYPLLVHHIVNLFLLCDCCHSKYGMFMQIQNIKVLQAIEEFLMSETPCFSELTYGAFLKDMIYGKYKKFINLCDTEKTVPNRTGG